MSSGRPSASAMDADAGPSPPRSKKRPSGKSDSDWSPNPSPRGSPSEHKRRRRTSAESAALALTAVAARASAASSDAGRGAVRRSLRPRRRAARVDGGDGGIQMLGDAAARVGGGRGGVKKYWSDADEFTLLAAAVAFRERNGRAPRLPDMAELFDSISDSISPDIDQFMVYYKMKRLKSKFQHSNGPSDRRLRNLCSILWGVGVVPSSEDDSDAAERRSVPDAAAMMPVVTEVLGEYWKTNERVMAPVPLEKGLSLLGKKEGRLLETKWRQQLDEEMQSQMRQHDLAKEVCGLLTDAIKGLGP
ncbi:hypothetical protein PAHAL_1G412300 [Panicum hallii]|uniref:Glabrous enhancer-binding protein-like DBD domain-containing protein n=1 Tax=Panicum hallii TaxID=206008 RepID=A0A2T8KXX4_9POAL|nr:uncharacterized protein LOC112900770 [Panicum hallii]XP_025825369.1 uncharacterized protein LOC112900770 [Panicum hallii]XP_025825375.1 uncharacterized protein LOC112900770 [Panicum hallii]PVH67020.1 hypothetical protein PAHAL_1G412300 [Panicum hallii]